MTTDNTSPAVIDLDAITKRARRVYPKRGWDGGEAERALPVVTEDVPSLVAEVRRLRSLRDDLADAFDGLVMKVWRAAGEEHEPPADVAALTDRVDALRCEVESYARRLAGRDETNANLLGRLIAAENTVTAARRDGAEAMREAAARAVAAEARSADARADRCGGDSNSRRAAIEVSATCDDLADAIRALPLPGGGS